MKKIISARDTLSEIAEFFHAVAHKKGLSISKGMSINELARQVGIKAPQSLRGTTILSTTAKPSKPRNGRPILAAIYEIPRGEPGVVEFKKCINVGTTSGPVTGNVKVCIDCSIRKMRCIISIEITGTIVIG